MTEPVDAPVARTYSGRVGGSTADAGSPRGPLAVLTRRAEFLAAARARRAGVSSLSLQARRRTPDEADPELVRMGFTCSRKVGNAVARNRAKRRLREAARAVLPLAGRPSWDYVLIGRPSTTADRPFPALLQDLRDALARVHARDHDGRRGGPARPDAHGPDVGRPRRPGAPPAGSP